MSTLKQKVKASKKRYKYNQDIDIQTIKSGDKVKYTDDVTEAQVNWGNHRDPRGVLVKNHIYTVDRIEIHSWHTRLWIRGFNGYYNPLWFKTRSTK